MRYAHQDSDGNITYMEVPDPPRSLNEIGALATLLCVLGLTNVEDAANAIGVTADALIAEAQAWAVAQSDRIDI